jgi:hypothetical protein
VAGQYVLVSLELTMDDQSKLRTAPMKVALYDETDSKAKEVYKRCVRWPDLKTLTGEKDEHNHPKLRSWVDKYVTGVVFKKSAAELDLGGSGLVGLTGDPDLDPELEPTGTKTLPALTDESLGQITAADLA